MNSLSNVEHVRKIINSDLTEYYFNKRFEITKSFSTYSIGSYIECEFVILHYYLKYKKSFPDGAIETIIILFVLLGFFVILEITLYLIIPHLILLVGTCLYYKGRMAFNNHQFCVKKSIEEIDKLVKSGFIKVLY